jgi:hypothetical protein
VVTLTLIVTTRLSIDSQVTDCFKAGITSFYSTSSQNLHKVVLVFKCHSRFTQFHLFIPYRRGENGDLVTDGNGGNIFDYTPGQLLNASRPTLSNENAFDRCIIIKLRIKEIILQLMHI